MKTYCPQYPLPAYAHHPGKTPHPCSHPEGHSYQKKSQGIVDLNLNDWKTCEPYLQGFDYYNQGYYWEAHEIWEELWHASQRSTTKGGKLLQALICLTGSALKNKMNESEQSQRLLKKANELFLKVDDCSFGFKTDAFTALPQTLELDFH